MPINLTGKFTPSAGANTFDLYDAIDIDWATLTSTAGALPYFATVGAPPTAQALSLLSIGTAGQVLTVSGGLPSWATPTAGTVTSVSGTANRITSTGGATPVIDIAATYVGQTSITTLGTITAGTWTGTAIAAANGGTGFASYAIGDLLYASGATTLSKLAAGTALQVLHGGTTPSWSAINLAAGGDVTGVLPLANGGTNNSTGTATINANLTGHVTSVGNAAVLGSFTSAQLLAALTGTTGTGANVFATSPTLVTPNIGVATASTLRIVNAADAYLYMDRSGSEAYIGVQTTPDLLSAAPSGSLVLRSPSEIWFSQDNTARVSIVGNTLKSFGHIVGLGGLTVSGEASIGTSLEINTIDSGDRNASIDFHASNAVDYSTRILRTPGTDGNMLFIQTGKGITAFSSEGALQAISCTANGTATLTSAMLFGLVTVGQYVSPTNGVPANTYVTAVANTSSITVSNAVTASGEPRSRTFAEGGPVVFLGPGNGPVNVGIGTSGPLTTLNVIGSVAFGRTAVNDAAFTVDSNAQPDYIIAYTALTASRVVTLKTASTAPTGRVIVIKDESGNAAVGKHIQISPAGSETIDGVTAASNGKRITTPYGGFEIYSTGTAWFTKAAF